MRDRQRAELKRRIILTFVGMMMLSIAALICSAQADEASFTAVQKKWTDIKPRITADAIAIAACRGDRTTCSSADLKFIAMVDLGRKRRGKERLAVVNRAVNLYIESVSDLVQYGVPDYWASPLQTLEHGAGDCEDYAILKYAILRDLGFDERDLHIAVVYIPSRKEYHAILTVRYDAKWLIMDNLAMAIINQEDAAWYNFMFWVG